MNINSFSFRVSLLLALMGVISAIDLWRLGSKSVKYKEYGFVLIAGTLGATVGFVNDLITSSMSPDYFILGKGLDAGSGLRWRAGIYGIQAGFSGGVIGGAICLYQSTISE